MSDEKEAKPEGSEQITIRVRDQVRRWHDDDMMRWWDDDAWLLLVHYTTSTSSTIDASSSITKYY